MFVQVRELITFDPNCPVMSAPEDREPPRPTVCGFQHATTGAHHGPKMISNMSMQLLTRATKSSV